MGLALSPETLQRLEERLRADDAQPLHGATAGLAAEQLSSLAATFAGDLPAEARLWWSWRQWGQGRVLPQAQYLRLAIAMAEYASGRREAAKLADAPFFDPIDPDQLWHPSWLPVFVIDSGMVLVIDASESDGASAPLRLIDWQDLGGTHFGRLVARSLGEYVTGALDAIDAGQWAYDPAFGDWRDTGWRPGTPQP
jgi:hypothetical protein